MEVTMRGKVRTQLTKLCKSATDYLGAIEWASPELNGEEVKTAIECLLTKIRSYNEQLKRCNEFIQPSVVGTDFERECDGIIEYEEKAMNAISLLESALDRITREVVVASVPIREVVEQRDIQVPSATSVPSRFNDIKLKPMELKKFKGNFEEWLPFWEQFRAAVHENEALSVTAKFSFLSNCLEGKAAASIAGLLPTANCYDEAIRILEEEYGNNDKLIEKYIQKLVALTAVNSSADVKGLRFLYNEVSATMRTLTALNVPSVKYELMVKSILLKSIPSVMRISYHRTAGQDNGEIKTLLEFLKNEIEAVEKSRLSETEQTFSENKKEHFKGTASALLLSSANSSSFCIFRKNNTHHTRSCKSKLSLNDKRAILKREGRCFRCANKSHTAKLCKAQYIKCESCNGRYMTSLCEHKIEEKPEQSLKKPTSSGTKNYRIQRSRQCLSEYVINHRQHTRTNVIYMGGLIFSYSN